MPVLLVEFSLLWKIEWSEFGDLPRKNIVKDLTTAYNNVVYYWRAEFSVTTFHETNPGKFSLFLYFTDGPLPRMGNMVFNCTQMQDKVQADAFDEEIFEIEHGTGWGYHNFDDRDARSLRQAYRFTDSKPLFCRIKLKIPLSAFSYKFNNPNMTATSSKWTRDLFQGIEDPAKATFSNAKIISREGAVFYCHKVVLGFQSPALAAMLHHPPANGQEEGRYPFPAMGTGSLKAMLEYLYTGKVTFTNLTMAAVIEVADAAEQYGLTSLNEGCRAILWNHAMEKFEESFRIIRFADLHQDMKHVKNRAMEVLARNYKKFSLQTAFTLLEKFGGDQQGEDLMAEFNLYLIRRVEPHFFTD